MTTNTEVTYWTSNPEWYTYDKEKKMFVLTDKAPERARKSYELASKQSR